MQIKKIKNALMFGLPSSKFIDKVLALRDENIKGINYFNTYTLIRKENGIYNFIGYMLPLFSYNGIVFSILKKKKIGKEYYMHFSNNKSSNLIESINENSIFNDMNFSKEAFEFHILQRLCDNVDILKDIITNNITINVISDNKQNVR